MMRGWNGRKTFVATTTAIINQNTLRLPPNLLLQQVTISNQTDGSAPMLVYFSISDPKSSINLVTKKRWIRNDNGSGGRSYMWQGSIRMPSDLSPILIATVINRTSANATIRLDVAGEVEVKK